MLQRVWTSTAATRRTPRRVLWTYSLSTQAPPSRRVAVGWTKVHSPVSPLRQTAMAVSSLHTSASLSVSDQYNDAVKTGEMPTRRKTAFDTYDMTHLVRAMKDFKAVYGHCVVPLTFNVPNTRDVTADGVTRWHPEMAGYELGHKLRTYFRNNRDRIQRLYPEIRPELEALGVDLDQDYNEMMWQQRDLAALRVFKSIYGHVNVEQKFLVPEGDARWPRASWGMALGKCVNTLRLLRRKLPSYKLEDLATLGFCWNTRELPKTPSARKPPAKSKFATSDFSQLPESMRLFKQRYGHIYVPLRYKVGDTMWPGVSAGEWPQEWIGYPLGHRLRSFWRSAERKTELPHITDALNELDVPLHQSERKVMWEHVSVAAVKTYKELYGDLLVHLDFVVPIHDDRWPRQTWGLQLGVWITNWRRGVPRLTASERQELDKLGFVWDVEEFRWSERVLPSMKVFYEEHGHSVVPQNFVVPAGDPWPQVAWGMRLGSIVSMIRSNERYKHQVARDVEALQQIEFVWDVHSHKWDSVWLPSLRVFKQEHNHCNVPQAFVVPSQAPWPEKAWGEALGLAVSNIRSVGHFADFVERDAEELQKLGFVFDHSQFKWDEHILVALRAYVDADGVSPMSRHFMVPGRLCAGE
ncbi:hypothetical protein PINS_up007042 [Pythium insidiosum]|nr:hypothetical protein PINS_up007042 [Pythium insidiosum]